jgi:hypothetical protein
VFLWHKKEADINQADAFRPEKCKEVVPRHKITQVRYSFHPRNQSNACKTGSPI